LTGRADKIDYATVNCEQHDIDRCKRVVAISRVGGADLGAWMVSEGLAFEYRRYSKGRYRDEEAAAKKAKRGLWSGRFEWPWGWRRNRR